jgi:ATP-binding cassette subfamily B protein
MTFYQKIAVGNIKELDNEALVEQQRKVYDKLALKFPEGYQQWLGRRFNDGVELSGGEWQKLL